MGSVNKTIYIGMDEPAEKIESLIQEAAEKLNVSFSQFVIEAAIERVKKGG